MSDPREPMPPPAEGEHQQQLEEERAVREAVRKSCEEAAYCDYHHQRGTGTWRDWPNRPEFDMQGYRDEKPAEPLQRRER